MLTTPPSLSSPCSSVSQVPKTTSGKIRRRATRQALKDGTLSALNPSVCGLSLAQAQAHTQQHSGASSASSLSPSPPAPLTTVRHDDLPPDAPLDAVVLHLLGVPAGTAVSSSTPLLSLGLTSMAAIEVSEALASRVGAMVPVEQLLSFTVGDVRRIRVDAHAVREAAEARRRMAEMPDLGLGTIAAAQGSKGEGVDDRGLPVASATSTEDGKKMIVDDSCSEEDDVSSDSSNEVDGPESDISFSGELQADSVPAVATDGGCSERERERERERELSAQAEAYVRAIATAWPEQEVPQWQFANEFLRRLGNNDPVLQDKLTRMCEWRGGGWRRGPW